MDEQLEAAESTHVISPDDAKVVKPSAKVTITFDGRTDDVQIWVVTD